jgi:Tfp pilus assembly protein PilF
VKSTIKILFIFTLFICKASGQSNELVAYVEKGIQLFDNGDYHGAMEQYQKALKLDNESDLVHYEVSSTYFVLKDYDKAIEHCDIVISINSKYVDQAYVLKGSSFDLLGKSSEAIKTYKKGIKKFPNDYLLLYNFALTSYQLKEYKETEDALQKALMVNPSHASSHFLLSYVMGDQGQRVKSLLALYNFLLLEPTGKRAEIAIKILEADLKKGVKRESDTSTTITLGGDDGSDEFRAAELMLSLLEASKSLEKNGNKTEYELFFESTDSFFSVLGELKKKNKGFWWNYYVDFFYAMSKDKHVETLSYYIAQSKEDDKITTWLKDNGSKIDALSKWYAWYER